MATFIDKPCKEQDCYNIFTPTGPASMYCSLCAARRAKESTLRSSYNYKLRNNQIDCPGVGSGNNQGRGEAHHSYVNGAGLFQTMRGEIRLERRYCNRCDKDLLNANSHFWCVHHIDHDRTNNDIDNLELLCKRCHQIEHDCHTAFERAETIQTE